MFGVKIGDEINLFDNYDVAKEKAFEGSELVFVVEVIAYNNADDIYLN